MPVAWFIAPYERMGGDQPRPTRILIVDRLTPTVYSEGGAWTETEVLGNHAIVKVRASNATLQAIANLPGVTRIPLARLDDPLSSLTVAQRNAIRDRVLALGYTQTELSAALPNNLNSYTLRDILRFAASRRLKPRYDRVSDSIVLDGPPQPVRPLGSVDAEVT